MDWGNNDLLELGQIIKGLIKMNRIYDSKVEMINPKCGTFILYYMKKIRINEIIIALCEEKLEELMKK